MVHATARLATEPSAPSEPSEPQIKISGTPWGGVLPIPATKTKVWIDIGTNINPIVAPSADVYMILV